MYISFFVEHIYNVDRADTVVQCSVNVPSWYLTTVTDVLKMLLGNTLYVCACVFRFSRYKLARLVTHL